MLCEVEEVRTLYQIRQVRKPGPQGCEFRIDWIFPWETVCRHRHNRIMDTRRFTSCRYL